MSDKYEIGDLVQLVTGGPIMVVIMNDVIMGENYVHCVWYDGKKYSRSHFPVKILNSASGPMLAHVQPSSELQEVRATG